LSTTTKNTTEKTLTRLHDLYFSETKPKKLKPIDLALLTYLILRGTDDHFIYDSQETLAARLGCTRNTIGTSIKRLQSLKWITVQRPTNWNEKMRRRSKAIYVPLGLSANIDQLPVSADRADRSAISEDARELAAQHTLIVMKFKGQSKYKQLPKNFGRFQESAAQRLIDELGSYDDVADVVNFAVNDSPQHHKAGITSLYAIRQRLGTIRTDMAAQGASTEGASAAL
jgi:Helix-turn-helix domain